MEKWPVKCLIIILYCTMYVMHLNDGKEEKRMPVTECYNDQRCGGNGKEDDSFTNLLLWTENEEVLQMPSFNQWLAFWSGKVELFSSEKCNRRIFFNRWIIIINCSKVIWCMQQLFDWRLEWIYDFDEMVLWPLYVMFTLFIVHVLRL